MGICRGMSTSKSKGEAHKRAARAQQCQLSPIPNARAEILGLDLAILGGPPCSNACIARAERSFPQQSHCLPASDSNAAGRRDASSISQMALSLPPRAFPGGTTVPPLPSTPTNGAGAPLAVQTLPAREDARARNYPEPVNRAKRASQAPLG